MCAKFCEGSVIMVGSTWVFVERTCIKPLLVALLVVTIIVSSDSGITAGSGTPSSAGGHINVVRVALMVLQRQGHLLVWR